MSLLTTLEIPFVRHLLSTLSPGALTTVFTLVNVLNYMDRGVVPGSYNSLGTFIRFEIGSSKTDFSLGLLQSMYIVGFALSCLVFGYAVRYVDSFKLMCVGLMIWVGAMFLCAFAPSFWVLLVGRVLSGAGEGSFQTVVPPYIDDFAPPSKRGLWLSLFFCAIPVGTALGTVSAGFLSSLYEATQPPFTIFNSSWRWTFALLGLAMVPFILLIWHAPSPGKAVEAHSSHSPASPGTLSPEITTNALAATAAAVGETRAAKLLRRGAGSSSGGGARLPTNPPSSPEQKSLLSNMLREDGYAGVSIPLEPIPFDSLEGGENGVGDDNTVGDEVGGTGGAPEVSFLKELFAILTDPLFMLITLGYAAFSAVLAALASFGPSFAQGLGLVSTQAEAATWFGVCVSLAGIVGTPLGGILLDVYTKRRKQVIQASDPILSAQLGLMFGNGDTPGSQGGSVFAVGGGGGGSGGDGDVGPVVGAGGYMSLDSVPPQYPSPSSPPLRDTSSSSTSSSSTSSPSSISALPPPSQNASNPFETDLKLNVAMPQASLLTLVGGSLCACGVLFGQGNKFMYFGLLTLGATGLCCTTAGVNQSIMASVRPESRAFAVGLATLLTHALGDVPSPLVLGALSDYLSPPQCLDPSPPSPPSTALGAAAYRDSASCDTIVRDRGGLTTALILTNLWLLWPVVLWAGAWVVSERRTKIRRGLAVRSARTVLPTQVMASLLGVLSGLRPRSLTQGFKSLLRRSRGGTAELGGDFNLLGAQEVEMRSSANPSPTVDEE